MLRNATLRRSVASFFLLELAGSLAAPSLSYALMGPGQPEFTSFESPGSTDMVSLTTGDLTYNLPVLEVPGPETTFSLPLTYRAGIRLEQEASWVGLGWSMNPGSIVRNVNGYPDDANGEVATNSYADPGYRGWYGGVPGLLSLAWNSETGHSGSASLLGFVSAGWSGGKLQSGDVVGIGGSRSGGFSIDAVKLATAAVSVATAGVGASVGIAQGISGAKVALQAVGALATGVGIAAFGKLGPSGGGFNQPTINYDHTWFRTKYWVFSNDTTKEAMYGSLNFGKLSTNGVQPVGTVALDPGRYGPDVFDGPANLTANKSRKAQQFRYTRLNSDKGTVTTDVGADMQQWTNNPADYNDYHNTSRGPISIAHDDFTVMGAGVSGTIRPQRLDVGSLSYPRQMLAQHAKYNLVPWDDTYKVQFRYDNSASNTYTYPTNANAPASNAPNGIAGGSDNATNLNSYWQNSQLVITDPKLYDPAKRTEANRKGLTDKKLVQGKQVAWYTNQELSDAYEIAGSVKPILEFEKPETKLTTVTTITGYNRVIESDEFGNANKVLQPIYSTTPSTTVQNFFRTQKPKNGIGAFAVTAEDGTTYHYSLPIEHYRQFSHTRKIKADGTDAGVSTSRTGAAATTNGANYATAWLLTAITGPDYIDQGDPGAVDELDQGTWVRFSYGKFSPQFKWRQPYVGEEYTPTDMSVRSYQEGAKETYYLNSIATRTHTALFIKSVRLDGRGHYGNKASNLGIIEDTPSSSLRLDEIVVLSNQDLKALQASTGFGTGSGNASTGLGGFDTFANVYDQGDFAASDDIRPYLNSKCLKRVVFNYSYRLCKGTPNSFASAGSPPALASTYSSAGRLGKLTLESIATYGAGNVKLIPDFRFDYANNPQYDPNRWDGFGMYCSAGTATNTTHAPAADFAQASQDGAAWSLTKIINPLGAVTDITYERDQYAHVSEYGTESWPISSNGQTNTFNLVGPGPDLRTRCQVGDMVSLGGTAIGTYSTSCAANCATGDNTVKLFIGGKRKVVAVTATSITVELLNGEVLSITKSPCQCVLDQPTSDHFTGSISLPGTTNGGDIRVAAVQTTDEANNHYTTKYQYVNSTLATGVSSGSMSSGVIAKEPEYVKKRDFDFYSLFDYPATSVMYAVTTVLRGNFKTPDDIDQREEYTFYTPNSSMVRTAQAFKIQTSAAYPLLNHTGSGSASDFTIVTGSVDLTQYSNTVDVDMGLLGQAASIRKYNGRGTLEARTVFNYATSLPNADGIASQGTFSEGTLLTEFLDVKTTPNAYPNPRASYHINYTTKNYLPATLLSTTTTTNNIAATTQNSLYDFYTGAVLETALTNSLGDRYRGRQVPAYTLYPAMGPKIEATGNRHMLTQAAATYTYKDNSNAPASLLTAGIQTWKGDWNTYRLYDAASDKYKADPAAQTSVWRQHRTYVWQSPQLNPDGTYASFVSYNWTTPTQAANWLNVGEVTLYDHYSRPLESRDINGLYASQKTGYNQSLAVAAAGNARYTEIAYSGAEDLTTAGTTQHFGGEVRDGGRQSALQKHTGQFSSLLTQANPLGFTYKATVGSDISTDRTYRASVWVYKSDADASTRLYLDLDGVNQAEATRLSTTTRRAGDWDLLTIYVTIPAAAAGKQLTVGCRRVGGSDVYVDDFRFHPVDAPLQANVYDPATRQLTHTLDNDNLYTRYQYDAAGKLVKVFREVLTPTGSTVPAERIIKESAYNYAQMKTPTWVEQGLLCETNSAGILTGWQSVKQRDTNTESPTYGQLRQVSNAIYAPQVCASPLCTTAYSRWNPTTNQCETATLVPITTFPDTQNQCIFEYHFSDGTPYLNASGNPVRVTRTPTNTRVCQ